MGVPRSNGLSEKVSYNYICIMFDFLLDNTLDLTVTPQGDFTVGESTAQEVEAIIMSFPGWWDDSILIGCGAPNYVASPGSCETLRAQIQAQLASDGKQLSSFSYSFINERLVINVNGITINV